MERLGRFLAATLKGVYDILASYLLVIVLLISALSLGLHAALSLLAQALDLEHVELMWRRLSWRVKLDPLWLRLALTVGAQALLLWLLKGALAPVWTRAERAVDALQRVYIRLGAHAPSLKRAFGALFTVAVTMTLIPFVVQPTLVGMRQDPRAWAERAANLADGSASLALSDSVIGFYRRLVAQPVAPPQRLPAQDIAQAFSGPEQSDEASGPLTAPPREDGKEPLMDRWDPLIWEAAQGDPRRFAQIKAFMHVESGGRQFAVSHTGCAGLMQFCSGTARDATFSPIFGKGQIYACGCSSTRCRIDREVQRDMERGDLNLIRSHAPSFPCEVTDARFNPARAIRAGALYIKNLDDALGGHIALMYVGYNSGPRVARDVYERLGRRPEASVEEIGVHLAASLSPYFGASAQARAGSLTRTHLPKIQRAFDRYHAQALSQKALAKAS